MKNLLAIALLILVFSATTSCNQTQKKTDKSMSLDTNKSSTKFTEVSKTSISNNGNYSYFFSVSVDNFDKYNDNCWDDILEEAMSKSYDNYTVVYFFDNVEQTPVFKNGCDFDKKYDDHCIAAFWHYPNGSTEFKKYPMQ